MALVLRGVSDLPNVQGLLFGTFFLIYIFILTGNSLIIIITRVDPVLQTPLYFFLANFSSLEICYVSVSLPRILVTLWTQDRSVSSLSCASRRASSLLRGAPPGGEACVLCIHVQPLHSPLLTTHRTGLQSAAGAWVREFRSPQHRHAGCPHCPSVFHSRSTASSVISPVDHPGLWGHCA